MKINIRVRFKDVDLSQRIHYTALFSYFEVADHEFFRHIGYPYKELFELNYYFPRVHVECDYLGTIEYDDLLELKTYIQRIGNTSFTYLFNVTKNVMTVAKGTMTIVCIDKESGKPQPIPDFIRDHLEKNLVK